MRRPRFRWFFLLFLLLIPTLALAQADAVATLQIVEVDQSQFPEMRVRFIAVDGDGEAVTTLANNDITLRENDQIVADAGLTTGTPIPDKIAIVLDLGKYNNLDQFGSSLRQYLLRFVAPETFRDGADTIALYAVNPNFPTTTQPLVQLTNSAGEYTRIVEQLSFDSTSGATSLDSVEYALDQLLNAPNAENSNLAIIYIGSLFDDPLGQIQHARSEANRVAERFNQAGVRFYGLQTQTDEFTEPIMALTDNSAGFYEPFLPSADNSSIVSRLIQDIETQNPTYQLSFRSTDDTDGTRSLTISTAGDRASAVQNYSVSVLPPEVRITSPLDEKLFARDAVENDDGTFGYTLNRFVVEGRIANWPDGKPRLVSSAELLVDDIVVQSIDNPVTDEFQFNVDISDYNDNITLPIVLRVRDELGLEASSATVNISIDVEPLPTVQQPVAPSVEPTATAASPSNSDDPIAPIPTSTPESPSSPLAPCQAEPFGQTCLFFIAPWIGMALSLLALAVLFTRYRQQMKNVGGRIAKVAEGVRRTLLGGEAHNAPLATLHILSAKSDRIGEVYEIFNDLTVLGRDPQYTDLQLFDSNDDSSVSGRHCTIQYERSLGQFLIMDHSTAGTRVNNQKLERDNPMVLGDGDEITLGLISKSGAKIRFELGVVEDPISAETVLDINLQQQGVDTIFDDVGNKTQFNFDEDNLSTGFETVRLPRDDDDDADDDWMRDLE